MGTTKRQNEIIYEMYKDVDIALDSPCFFYWDQILSVFPEAKCIFYERDVDRWFKSFNKMFDTFIENQKIPDVFSHCFTYIFCPKLLKMHEMFSKINILLFSSKIRLMYLDWSRLKVDEYMTKLNYKKHNAHFMVNCPEKKRLVLKKLGDWQPICDFIGIKTPDFEFPHENKGDDVDVMTKIFSGKGNSREFEDINFNKVITKQFMEGCIRVGGIIMILV